MQARMYGRMLGRGGRGEFEGAARGKNITDSIKGKAGVKSLTYTPGIQNIIYARYQFARAS